MNTFSQWVHQHNLLLLGAAVVAGTGRRKAGGVCS
jgi:hypothetical protein